MSASEWLIWGTAVDYVLTGQNIEPTETTRRNASRALFRRAATGKIRTCAISWTILDGRDDSRSGRMEANVEHRLELLAEIKRFYDGENGVNIQLEDTASGDLDAMFERRSLDRHSVVYHAITSLRFSRGDIDETFELAAQPKAEFAGGGRARKWNWDGAMAHLLARANTPDGLPTGHGAQAEIGRYMAAWFRENENGEPAPSEISKRARMIMTEIDRLRKPE